MKYIKLYENRHDFVFDEQRFFPNTSLVQGEEEPTYFTDVEEVVFELTVSLPTEKVVTGETYTLAVEYGGADVFEDSTVTTTGDVTLNGTQFTANTDGDFSVTATYGDKTVTLNGTSKLMTAAPTISKYGVSACGRHLIDIVGNGTKKGTFDGVEYTNPSNLIRKALCEGDTARDAVVTATAQEEGKWESDVVTATFSIPAAQTFTATISDDTLEDGQTAQITVMYGSADVSNSSEVVTRASGDLQVKTAPNFIAHYSTGSGSVEVWSTNPNLPHITINVTVTEAVQNIVFADNDVKTIVANAYGSNGEITEEQAAAVTTWFSNVNNNPFNNNDAVDSFDEFSYFTGVTEIGDYAFRGCTNMRSITLPSSLTSISRYTFMYCSSLGSVTIPASVTSIGGGAFYGCSSLTRITCNATTPPTLDSWGGSSDHFDLTNNCPIYVPEESVSIYKAATGWSKYASRIKSRNMTFDDPAVDSIVTTAFGSNGKITYDEAAAVKTWFSGTDSSTNPFYKNVYVSTFPEFTYFTGVTEIGNNAFSLCSNMTSITLPSRVTSIGDYTFTGCEKLENVNIPETVTSIGNGAFYNCNSIQSITIPKNVTSIGDSAFNRCTTLPNITIPASVTRIGNEAFRKCTQLSGVTCEATTPPTLGSDAFTETSNCPIYVPEESLDAYKAATGWSNFADRIQAIQYAVAVLDCSELADANPLETCENYDIEAEELPEGLNTLDCSFDGEVSYVENGVITIPNNGSFMGFSVYVNPPDDGYIVYVKLTHPSAEYKLNADTTVLNTDCFTWDLTFDPDTLTTTINNIVQLENIVFDGSNFELVNGGESDIKITRIEVGYVPAAEE